MELIIFIGIQATGKSEFYKQYFLNTHIRINLDMLKTRTRENILVNACFDSKQSLVIDNTNPTPEDRFRYIERAKKAKFKVIGYYFKSSLTEAIERNENRIGQAKVPVPAILGTYGKMKLPDYDEGFDELKYVMTDGKCGFIIEDFKDEI